MPLIACVWTKGRKGRATKAEEDIALAWLRQQDPSITVPVGVRINDTDFIIKWCDTPEPNGVL